ncbi:MAG TPA: hypothetical protein VGJ84_16780, partial [Polyangiaceae bacterium]
MVKRWLALVAACLLSSCSVAVVRDEKVEQTKNVCEADAECGGGQCVEGRCAAQKGTFETVLFEVTAPSDANAIAGVRFLKRVDNIPTEGGQLDLSLGHVADVTGRVVLPPVVNQNPAGSSCTYRFLPETGNNALSTAPDGSIPATLVFTPSERLLGLPASSYTAEAAAVKNESGAITSYGFRVRLAPGLYDIYLKPGEPDPASCTVPPQELLAQMIDAGDVKFDINLPPPQHLTVTVEWGAIDCPPEGCATLNGWTADIIDPVTGRVLSNTATLLDNKSLVSNGVRQYSLNMDVSTVVGAEPSLVGQELFRLSPPAELAAPTLLVTRTVIELSQRGVGVVNQF